jgi:hypothetical protein
VIFRNLPASGQSGENQNHAGVMFPEVCGCSSVSMSIVSGLLLRILTGCAVPPRVPSVRLQADEVAGKVMDSNRSYYGPEIRFGDITLGVGSVAIMLIGINNPLSFFQLV